MRVWKVISIQYYIDFINSVFHDLFYKNIHMAKIQDSEVKL